LDVLHVWVLVGAHAEVARLQVLLQLGVRFLLLMAHGVVPVLSKVVRGHLRH